MSDGLTVGHGELYRVKALVLQMASGEWDCKFEYAVSWSESSVLFLLWAGPS